jgi:hypothetical protein
MNSGKSTSFETLFQPNNFLHLTGAKSVLNSDYFFKAALNRKLSPDNISLEPGGTAELKLDVLPRLMSIHTAARMVGDYDNSRPLLITDKIAGTITMAMGFINVNGALIPNTAMKKDVRDIAARPACHRMAATFTKYWRDEK